jgi:ABC-type phosphate/phosphonate transport system substrate-binding protein
MDWYYVEKGEKKGPVEAETLKALRSSGSLPNDTLVWNQSMGNQWVKISVAVHGVSFLADPPATCGTV